MQIFNIARKSTATPLYPPRNTVYLTKEESSVNPQMTSHGYNRDEDKLQIPGRTSETFFKIKDFDYFLSKYNERFYRNWKQTNKTLAEIQDRPISLHF